MCLGCAKEVLYNVLYCRSTSATGERLLYLEVLRTLLELGRAGLARWDSHLDRQKVMTAKQILASSPACDFRIPISFLAQDSEHGRTILQHHVNGRSFLS